MNVREVLDIAVNYLGLKDLSFATDCRVVISDKRAVDLIRAINLINSEIASEYFPLLKEEKITTDGIIEYVSLEDRLLDVVSIKSQSGENVRCKLYPSYLKVKEKGEYIIQYQYLPPKLEYHSELPYGVKISPRLIALGVASEYCLINGMYEEGVLFDKKYREALRTALIAKGERKVKRRRW